MRGGLEAPFSPYKISAVKEFSVASQLASAYRGAGGSFSPYEISAVKEFSVASQLASAYIIEEVTSICYQLELGK